MATATVSCPQLSFGCPCWSLDKCIETCPTGGSESSFCANGSCCHAVTVCKIDTDVLKVDYRLTAEQTAPSVAFYTARLNVSGLNPGTAQSISYQTVLLCGSSIIPISPLLTFTAPSLSDGTLSVPLSGSFDISSLSQCTDPSCEVAISYNLDPSSLSGQLSLGTCAEILAEQCPITSWCLQDLPDEGGPGQSFTITGPAVEEIEVDYGPEACSESPIRNNLALFNGPCPAPQGAQPIADTSPFFANVTVFEPNDTPTNPSVDDPQAVTLGMVFTSDVDGFVTGIRFYKGVNNTGPPTGALWDVATGLQLGPTLTFTGETATGWQEQDYPAGSQVPIVANHPYIVSYWTGSGNYAGDNLYPPFTPSGSGVNNPPLHAPNNTQAVSEGAAGQGVFIYGSSINYPDNTFKDTNYWVDLVFTSSLTPDSTQLTINCVRPSIVCTSSLVCEDHTQWCLCKTSQVVKDSPGLGCPPTLIGYAVTATPQKVVQICNLQWSFTVSIPCLDYEKQFTYTVTQGGVVVPNGAGTFSLGGSGGDTAGPFTGSFSTTSTIPLIVTVSWNTETYGLKDCSLVPLSGTDSVSMQCPVTEQLIPQTVTVTDAFTSTPAGCAVLQIPGQGCPFVDNNTSPDIGVIDELLSPGGVVVSSEPPIEAIFEFVVDASRCTSVTNKASFTVVVNGSTIQSGSSQVLDVLI